MLARAGIDVEREAEVCGVEFIHLFRFGCCLSLLQLIVSPTLHESPSNILYYARTGKQYWRILDVMGCQEYNISHLNTFLKGSAAP